MIRRTFLSAILASVAVLFGKAKANREWKFRSLFVSRVQGEHLEWWLDTPDKEGQWWWRRECGSGTLATIVPVWKKYGKLYARWYNHQWLCYVEAVASEMGGEWRLYKDQR